MRLTSTMLKYVLALLVAVLFVMNTWTILTYTNHRSSPHNVGSFNPYVQRTSRHQPGTEFPLQPTALHAKCQRILHGLELRNGLILGKLRDDKVFLSVGLIYSTGEETALLVAVNSIFDHVTPEVYDDVIVVVVMSDSDQSTFLEYMHSEFSEYLQLGLLQVISPTESFYRAVDRGGINWEEEGFSEDFKRSITEFNKRLIFLLEYSAHISEFYLQLSSFSRVSTHFLPIIKGTLNANGNASFAFGNFNQRGILSLGALYPSSVLSEVAEFGAMFPSGRLPCEIFNTFFYIRVSNDKVLATKDLFWFMKEKQGHKPDVEFHSSIESKSQFEVEKAYLEEAGYHWAIRPKAGQNLVMTFKTPVRLSRVLITSGTPFFRDVLKAGVVKVCEAGSGPLDCDHSKCVDIGRVVDTVVDVGGLEGSLSFPVKCLQLVIEKDHHSWVIIRDISVWIRS